MWTRPSSSSSRVGGSRTPLAKPIRSAPRIHISSAGDFWKSGLSHSAKVDCNAGISISRNRLHQTGDAVGRQQRGNRSRRGQTRPTCPLAAQRELAGRRLHHRLAAEKGGERQPDHKTAMQIGPQRHHGQRREGRRAIGVARAEQQPRPQHEERQGQDMRPGQGVRLQQGGGGDGRDQRRQRRQPAAAGNASAGRRRAATLAAVSMMTPPQPNAS